MFWLIRRGGRAVECAGFENRSARKGRGSSNLPLSVFTLLERGQPVKSGRSRVLSVRVCPEKPPVNPPAVDPPTPTTASREKNSSEFTDRAGLGCVIRKDEPARVPHLQRPRRGPRSDQGLPPEALRVGTADCSGPRSRRLVRRKLCPIQLSRSLRRPFRRPRRCRTFGLAFELFSGTQGTAAGRSCPR